MQVHLVDGTYELFRSFFGAPAATGPDGREVGAVRGIARSLNALLKTPGVTHVACAFDHVIESFRNQLFAGYKTGAGIEPSLLAQFDLAEEACAALGIVTWSMIEFEADDALATFAARARDDARVDQVVICSPDKDLAQCVVGSRVICLDRMRNKTLDADGVVAKFGVAPASIPDFLALVGDSADGIPGIPGWGAKSAAIMLAHYGTLENIPNEVSAWEVTLRGKQTLAQNFFERRREALLYKTLATLRSDVPLAESLLDLEYRGADPARLAALSATLGDPGLLERVPMRAS